MSDNGTNYIDRIAMDIHVAAEPGVDAWLDLELYRIYAVLALAKGEAVTDRDVHDAWSAWASKYTPFHPSLIPFDELSEHVQSLDAPYTAAIHKVAQQHLQAANAPQ